MAVEAVRGCGYRQVGGLYMVSGSLSSPCGRLPLELHVCAACHQGVHQTRGWSWVNPGKMLAGAKVCALADYDFGRQCQRCPLAPFNLEKLDRAGLIWVGGKFYPEPDDFMQEAARLGVSRRLPAIPRGFKLGEDWVLVAHPRAVKRAPVTPEEVQEAEEANTEQLIRKGIVTMFKPTAIEKLFDESDRGTDRVQEAIDKGITPVFVPDDDKDHHGGGRKKVRQADIEDTDSLGADL